MAGVEWMRVVASKYREVMGTDGAGEWGGICLILLMRRGALESF